MNGHSLRGRNKGRCKLCILKCQPCESCFHLIHQLLISSSTFPIRPQGRLPPCAHLYPSIPFYKFPPTLSTSRRPQLFAATSTVLRLLTLLQIDCLGGGKSRNLGSGFAAARRTSIYTDPEMDVQGFGADDDDELGVCSDSSSSVGSRSGSSDDEAVESSPLDTMDALEEVLPVRRGISKFYNGKSKSFTSLADAVSSASIKELAKPETLYSKKNVNSLRSNRGGLLKKRFPSNYGNRYIVDEPCSSSISPPVCLPPLHPQSKKFHNAGSSVSPPQQKCPPWRSFSVSDLSGMVHNA